MATANLDDTKYLNPDEARRVIDWLEGRARRAMRNRRCWRETRDWAFYATALYSGLRQCELVGLLVSDLEVDARGGPRIRVRAEVAKGHQGRVVHAYADLRPVLEAYLPVVETQFRLDGPLFPGASGKPMSTPTARRRWAEILRQAGIKYRSLHATRHTFGTMRYRGTKNLRLVQRELGHRSPTTTAIYADVLTEDREAAAAVRPF